MLILFIREMAILKDLHLYIKNRINIFAHLITFLFAVFLPSNKYYENGIDSEIDKMKNNESLVKKEVLEEILN